MAVEDSFVTIPEMSLKTGVATRTIKRNWLLSLRIQHEILRNKRAEYGEQVVKVLAKDHGDTVNEQTILHALSAKLLPGVTGQSRALQKP